MSKRLDQLADKAYTLAQQRQIAIIMKCNMPMVTGTHTREFRRTNPDVIIGVYNEHAQFNWIKEDLQNALPHF